MFLSGKLLYFFLGLCDYSDKFPDCRSWRFSYIILPALIETLFFSSIDLLFPFLLRTNIRWLEFC